MLFSYAIVVPVVVAGIVVIIHRQRRRYHHHQDIALRLVPSLNENCDRSSQCQHLSYIFLHKIFDKGWMWL